MTVDPVRCGRETVHHRRLDLERDLVGGEVVAVDDVLDFEAGRADKVDAAQFEVFGRSVRTTPQLGPGVLEHAVARPFPT